MKKTISLVSILTSTVLFAGIPTQSTITQNTKEFSAKKYPIAGKACKYRCAVVQKKQCQKGSKAEIIPTSKEVLVKDKQTGKKQFLWLTDIRIEDDAANGKWYVCGAALGEKKGELKGQKVIAFTDIDENKVQGSSYMTISHQQICR